MLKNGPFMLSRQKLNAVLIECQEVLRKMHLRIVEGPACFVSGDQHGSV